MASKIHQAQHDFAIAFCKLCLEAEDMGYMIAFDDAYRNPEVFGEYGEKMGYGHKKSLHKLRLAVDLILKDKHFKIQGAEAHNRLHKKWVKMGGNPPIDGDSRHYSWPWGSVR